MAFTKTIPIVLCIATLFPFGALAQTQQCAPRAVVLEQLSERFGETRQSVGLAGGNRVVETFAARNTGSWTITVTLPNGLTCLVASGQAFETMVEAPAPSGTPS